MVILRRLLVTAVIVACGAIGVAHADVYPGTPVQLGNLGGATAGSLFGLYLRLDLTNVPVTGTSLDLVHAGNSGSGFTITNSTAGTLATEVISFIHDGATNKYGSLSFTNTSWNGALLPLRALQLQLTTGDGASGGIVFVSNSTATTSDMVFAVGQGATIERLRFGMAAQKEAVFNEGSADIDFRVESDSDANAIFLDATTSRLGIGTASPGASALLDVAGGLRLGTTTLALLTSNVTATAGIDTSFTFNGVGTVFTDYLLGWSQSGAPVAGVNAIGGVMAGDGDCALGTNMGIGFLLDVNTGICRSGADDINIVANGTPNIEVQSTATRVYKDVIPGFDNTTALGVAGGRYQYVYTLNLSGGGTSGVAVQDNLRVGVDVAGAAQGVYVQLPRQVATTIGSKPACAASTDAGSLIYVDDTDDIVPGAMCICNASAIGSYAWRMVTDLTTSCP